MVKTKRGKIRKYDKTLNMIVPCCTIDNYFHNRSFVSILTPEHYRCWLSVKNICRIIGPWKSSVYCQYCRIIMWQTVSKCNVALVGEEGKRNHTQVKERHMSEVLITRNSFVTNKAENIKLENWWKQTAIPIFIFELRKILL